MIQELTTTNPTKNNDVGEVMVVMGDDIADGLVIDSPQRCDSYDDAFASLCCPATDYINTSAHRAVRGIFQDMLGVSLRAPEGPNQSITIQPDASVDYQVPTLAWYGSDRVRHIRNRRPSEAPDRSITIPPDASVEYQAPTLVWYGSDRVRHIIEDIRLIRDINGILPVDYCLAIEASKRLPSPPPKKKTVLHMKRITDAIRELNTEPGTSDADTCAVCMDNKRTVAFVPCGHLFCPDCAREICTTASPKKCPVCRKTVSQLCRVFV